MSKKTTASPRLGELETAIMNVVWRKGEATVQEVRDALEPDRSPAYTTVMTVMSRLATKGLLERQKNGRAYVYRPATEQDQLAGSMLSSLVDKLYDGSATRAIAHLIETEDEVDDAELDRLEQLIRRRRGKTR